MTRRARGAVTANPARPTRASATALHREWLTLVDIDGPFLAAPALVEV